jgi:ABC-2 type transport system permease protein
MKSKEIKKVLIEFVESLKIGVKKSLALKYVFISEILSTIFGIFILFLIWWVIFTSLGLKELHGYKLEDLVIYYSIVNLIHLFTYNLSDFTWKFYYLVKDGTLSNYLTKPWNLIVIIIGEGLGYSLLFLLFALFIFVILVLIKGYSLINLLLFLILVLFITFFHIAARLTIAFLSFWLEDLWFATELYSLIVGFLSGLIIPITFYPLWLQKIIDWLPFKYIYFYPTELITKGTDINSFIKAIAILTISGVLLLIVAKILWNKGIKKYNAYGG